jgi:hypothetical protein
MWTEIGRYRTGTADGNTEDFVLEKDSNGNFRIRNDFGNIVIDFERMSGYEFFRKVKRTLEQDIEEELNELWDDIDLGDDCDSDDDFDTTDNDIYGAD